MTRSRIDIPAPARSATISTTTATPSSTKACSASTQTPALDLSAAPPAADFGFALDTGLGKLAVGTRLATSPSSVAVNVFDTEIGSPQLPANVDFSVNMRRLQPDVLSVALVQPVGTDLGAYNSLAPERIVVGVLNSDNRSLSIDPRVAAFGLHCEAGEACANRGTDPSATTTPFSDALSISPGGDGTLVVYARNEDRTADLCTAPDAVAHKPLLANVLTRTAQGLGELTQAAVPIGISTEGGAPAVLALPGLTTNGAAFGWLVAYPVEGGDLVISGISFRFDQLQFNRPLLRIAASAGPLHAPHMAARPLNQAMLEHLLIGLVAQRDCGDASRVVFAELDATLNPDASVELRVHKDFMELGGDAGQHAAAISYRNGTQQLDGDRRSWGVAYRDASGRPRALDRGQRRAQRRRALPADGPRRQQRHASRSHRHRTLARGHRAGSPCTPTRSHQQHCYAAP